MDSFSYFGALDFLLNDLFRLFLTKWMDWEKKTNVHHLHRRIFLA